MSTRKFFLSTSLVFFLALLSCNKDKKEDAKITGITPGNGPYSTIVTVTGSGFNPTTTDNVVKFNGKDAVVQSASSTQLVVIVPKLAGTGPVSVSNISGPVFDFIYTITASTFAGTANGGFADGSSAQFSNPKAVAIDLIGNVYIADEGNHRIRKITSSGLASTIAGTGTEGYVDGNGSSAQFNSPRGIALDANGNIYVADANNHRIRKITPSGVVSTLAGDGTSGFADGNGSSARFSLPFGLAVDINGNVYVGDAGNHRIRKISPAGVVSTLAGSGTYGFADGDGTSAQFNNPSGIAVNSGGEVFVADNNNHRIRKISPGGTVTTLAGTGEAGFADGNGALAQFGDPAGVTVDAIGNVYVGDLSNQRIRKITSAGLVSTVAGNGTAGFADGNSNSAQFDYPYGVAVDGHENVFVADYYNNRIRKITVE